MQTMADSVRKIPKWLTVIQRIVLYGAMFFAGALASVPNLDLLPLWFVIGATPLLDDSKQIAERLRTATGTLSLSRALGAVLRPFLWPLVVWFGTFCLGLVARGFYPLHSIVVITVVLCLWSSIRLSRHPRLAQGLIPMIFILSLFYLAFFPPLGSAPGAAGIKYGNPIVLVAISIVAGAIFLVTTVVEVRLQLRDASK